MDANALLALLISLVDPAGNNNGEIVVRLSHLKAAQAALAAQAQKQ